jgi:hypothetical protein
MCADGHEQAPSRDSAQPAPRALRALGLGALILAVATAGCWPSPAGPRDGDDSEERESGEGGPGSFRPAALYFTAPPPGPATKKGALPPSGVRAQVHLLDPVHLHPEDHHSIGGDRAEPHRAEGHARG